MNHLGKYWLAKAETAAARHGLDSAALALEIAGIRERLAEIKSQHEPLNSLIGKPMAERDRLYAAAFYVVVGRMPTEDAP